MLSIAFRESRGHFRTAAVHWREDTRMRLCGVVDLLADRRHKACIKALQRIQAMADLQVAIGKLDVRKKRCEVDFNIDFIAIRLFPSAVRVENAAREKKSVSTLSGLFHTVSR